MFLVEKSSENVFAGVAALIEGAKEDYREWHRRSTIGNDSVSESMIKEFDETIRYEEGRKYIKVIKGTSVHCFVMKEDDKKFRAGDILMAASWAAPARNFPRGNVLDGGYNIMWTGAVSAA